MWIENLISDLWGAPAIASPLQGEFRISSPFGQRDAPMAGASTFHKGIDYAAPLGTPVYASHSGTVLTPSSAGGYGNLVKLQGPNGLETRYGHLDSFAPGLKSGTQISQGALLGYVGSTGNSTGPHLHYETRQNGKAVDPNKMSIGGWLERSAAVAEPSFMDTLGAVFNVMGSSPFPTVSAGANLASIATGTGETGENFWSGIGDWLSRGVMIILGLIIFAAAVWMLTAANKTIVIPAQKKLA